MYIDCPRRQYAPWWFCFGIGSGALELPDGKIVLLTHLCKGQRATVLQLPSAPVALEVKQSQDAFVV
jgi:hypothetical protein